MRRADRLFQIVQILRRSTRPVTSAMLAAELEVSLVMGSIKVTGGATREVVIEAQSRAEDEGRKESASKRVVATYEYRDEQGALLVAVDRLQPKGFRQRRPDGLGGWAHDAKGVRRTLYRLPELQGQRSVFVVEGEKDADRLVAEGVAATTNAGGAGKCECLPEAHQRLGQLA